MAAGNDLSEKIVHSKCRREDVCSGGDSGPFSDPVFKKLSKLNGEINRMTKEQIQAKLAEFHIDTR